MEWDLKQVNDSWSLHPHWMLPSAPVLPLLITLCFSELWREHQAKLGEGETMASRPDLLQELGTLTQGGDTGKRVADQDEDNRPSQRYTLPLIIDI